MTVPHRQRSQVWFLTGSQDLYGPETLDQVADQSQQIADARPRPASSSVEIVWKPVLTDADGDPPGDAGGQRRPGLHRRDRLDAHLLAGQDVDRRAGRAAQAAAAPAHPGQRGAAVGVHRHGLHEPQPGRARRPGVRLHPDPARRGPQDRRRARRPTRALVAPDRRLGRAPRAARGDLRTLRLARFGDNMRDVAVTEGDKVEAELRFGVSVNTYGVNDLVAVGRRGRRRRRSTRWSAEYADALPAGPRAAPGRRAARVAALRRADRGRAAAVPRPTAGSAPSPPTSRTSAGCASCPGWPCSG